MRTSRLTNLLIVVLLAQLCQSTSLVNARPETDATRAPIVQASIPAPEDVLGFRPGDDRKLASWSSIVDYFKKLASASDRVTFTELGKTTMGRPFVAATISAPENLAHLDEYQRIQSQLADPRKLAGYSAKRIAQLISRGKTVVLITCGIHSTEVGSTLSSTLIAHRLASSNEPEIQEILRHTIILLVPSLNPDGVDIVKNWYDKTLNTPYEGTDPPELYHKYTGHDNNRDWYAFSQVETRLTVEKLHNAWHPQIVHDIHQQGAFGSRLFLPPYMKPVEPNVPRQIVEGYTELGNYMAREMRATGFQGITTDSTYDAWTPARAYSHYHGGVRILSETASCRLATPIKIKFDELTSREGYDPRKETPNFGPVWRGGEWRLRDITSNMTTAAFFLLKHAAQHREAWLQRFYAIGKEAVRPRKPAELNAILVLPSASEQRYTATLGSKASDELLGILEMADVEVEPARRLVINGKPYPEGTEVIRMNQPYGAFAKALLEAQHYPDLRDAAGHPIAPYDVTAHTLSLLMGVEVKTQYAPFKFVKARQVTGGKNGGCGDAGTPVRAIYRSQVPAMDEGWTRSILDKQGCTNYATIEDREVRAGNLRAKYETILIPDQQARVILNGHRSGAMPPEYTGGLGDKGVKALREFVEAGGRLVLLNRASDFAIEQFKLPIKNVTAGLPRTDYYVPGSILRIELDTSNPLASGMPKESIAWAEDSPVFEVTGGGTGGGTGVPPVNSRASPNIGAPAMPQVSVVAWYPKDRDPLLSGWLLGGNRLRGKAALVEVKLGQGRIILFGFRPQYRAQSLATYPLFFNAFI
ncbi:MAG TPA: M14 metallopeptidase family protein [Pyrinomonadaceae bacterium]|nr:M14 metallopeptidase family protein [Pyrinomonadaceae bacterium]